MLSGLGRMTLASFEGLNGVWGLCVEGLGLGAFELYS